MRCANCGRETDRRPGEVCPVCGAVLGPVQAPATPESSIQGFGAVARGIREARSRSPAVRAGSVLILLVLALMGGAWLYSVLQQAGGRPTAALALPLAWLLFTAVLGWRWLK